MLMYVIQTVFDYIFETIPNRYACCFLFIFPLMQASSVTLSWDPNTENDLNGYKIYYGTASRNYDNIIDVGSVTSYRVRNLETGRRYFLAVTAYDFSGNESEFSEEVDVVLENTSDDTSSNKLNTLMPSVYNYPNPFRVDKENTKIRYELTQSSSVTIEVFDLKNNLIKALIKSVSKSVGEHTEDVWDGTNSNGELVANGVYICRVRTDDDQRIIKIAVTR